MLQPSHRGIYEFLWSEHKYPLMAVSLKAFQGMASRLGKRPQLLALLRKIAEYAFADKAENYNALLNAYMHIKPSLTRARRQEIIEALLVDEDLAAEMIYEDAVKTHEMSIAGCRLFFPSEHAIYKFWDAQGRPGLWLCFGPMQLHLTPQQVFSRVSIEAEISVSELQKSLEHLRHGVSAGEFSNWPAKLRLTLQQNNMVAIPGGRSAWLHPRVPLSLCEVEPAKAECDFLSAAALTLEKMWDAAQYSPEAIGQLPDYQAFCKAYQESIHPAVVWQKDFNCNEAFEFLGHLFWQQWCKDNGQAGETAEDDSGPGVGMETADEEIDPEEGEHGDDETCD